MPFPYVYSRATSLAPGDPNSFENLGVGYLRLGMRVNGPASVSAFAASERAFQEAKKLATDQGRASDLATIEQNLVDLHNTMNNMGINDLYVVAVCSAACSSSSCLV